MLLGSGVLHWSWSLCKTLGRRCTAGGKERAWNLTLTVVGLFHRSLLDGWGFAPSLLLHSLQELLKMAPANTSSNTQLSSWVKCKCTGNVFRVIWTRRFKTTRLPQREKKVIMGMAVLMGWLTSDAPILKCFSHRAGVAYGARGDILIYWGSTDEIQYILLMVKGRELCKGTIFFIKRLSWGLQMSLPTWLQFDFEGTR